MDRQRHGRLHPRRERIVRRASGRTKTEARAQLKELLRDHEDGHAIAPHGYTVTDAVADWLTYGLTDRDPTTVEKLRYLARDPVLPDLGARKLRELTAEDVDRWLVAKARTLSSNTVSTIKSILRRSITRAQARDMVKRNVVLLCGTPTGQPGRPSKSLSSTRPMPSSNRPAAQPSAPTYCWPCSLAPAPRSCAP